MDGNDIAGQVKDYLFKEFVVLYEASLRAEGESLAELAIAMVEITDRLLCDYEPAEEAAFAEALLKAVGEHREDTSWLDHLGGGRHSVEGFPGRRRDKTIPAYLERATEAPTASQGGTMTWKARSAGDTA